MYEFFAFSSYDSLSFWRESDSILYELIWHRCGEDNEKEFVLRLGKTAERCSSGGTLIVEGGFRIDKVNFCREIAGGSCWDSRSSVVCRHADTSRRPHYETAFFFPVDRASQSVTDTIYDESRGVPPHSDCRDNDFSDCHDNWRLGSATSIGSHSRLYERRFRVGNIIGFRCPGGRSREGFRGLNDLSSKLSGSAHLSRKDAKEGERTFPAGTAYKLSR